MVQPWIFHLLSTLVDYSPFSLVVSLVLLVQFSMKEIFYSSILDFLTLTYFQFSQSVTLFEMFSQRYKFHT